jgi:hypothetical protein
MAALVDEWRTTLTSASTTKVYTERTCVWLVWCEQRRIEPLRVTWSNIACHLSQYAGDPLRRSAIRNFYKWLASTGRIESDPSMAPSVKTGCLWSRCKLARYGSEFCRKHHIANDGATGRERTCRVCGNTKLATEFVPRELLCKQCRPAARKSSRAQRVAAGELKRCTRCGEDKPRCRRKPQISQAPLWLVSTASRTQRQKRALLQTMRRPRTPRPRCHDRM